MFPRSHATLHKCFRSRAFSAKKAQEGATEFFSGRGCLYLAGLKLPQSVKDSPQIPEIVATKIGCVEGALEQVEQRRKTFQTAHPMQFEMKHVYPCKYQYQVESIWKNHFEEKAVGVGAGTEWFHLDDSDIRFIASKMATFEKTGELLGHNITNELAVVPAKESSVDDKEGQQPAEQSRTERLEAILKTHIGIMDGFNQERSYLNATDFATVFAALCEHPNSAEKIHAGCAVEEIFISRNPFDESEFCFFIKRKDGSEEGIDYEREFCFCIQRKDESEEGIDYNEERDVFTQEFLSDIFHDCYNHSEECSGYYDTAYWTDGWAISRYWKDGKPFYEMERY